MLELPLDPFTVERGEPHTGLIDGTSEAVWRNYKLIDRVGLDFTYREGGAGCEGLPSPGCWQRCCAG